MIQEINMEEKTLTILEYDKIIEKLTHYASSDMGRTMCSKLLPSSDFDEILNRTADRVAALELQHTG